MAESERPSSGLNLLRAQAAWSSEKSDVLAHVFHVAVTARTALAVHAVFVNTVLISPVATNSLGVMAVSVVLLGWQVFVSALMRKPEHRNTKVLALDVAMTLAIVASTIWFVPYHATPLSLAGYWLGGPAGYAAVFFGTLCGVCVALISCGAFLLLPGFILERLGISFVTVLVTFCLGRLIEQFRNTIVEQERERLRAAALAERQRLSRIVHDGVLQVLALVEREGPTLGVRGAKLAALAHESETKLRSLLQEKEDLVNEETESIDLASQLAIYDSSKVTVSTMASVVMVSRLLFSEVDAAISEILKNVELHAGPEASTWILLDQETDDEVIIWVRDNGVGMSAEHVAQAAQAGRMGIKDSIVGRMAALGGSAILKSSPGAGTEWELRFPTNIEVVK